MGNSLKNAGGLDGILNWNVAGGGVLAADEAIIGAPGRAVLQLSGTGVSGSTYGIFSDPIAATGGQAMEAYLGWQTTTLPSFAYVQPLDGAGGVLGQNLQLSVVRTQRIVGGGKRGLAYSFNRSYGQPVMPAGTASVRIAAVTTLAANGGFGVSVLKPYLAPAPNWARPTVWDPGSHANPDLQLPTWPSDLPPFQADALPEPIANMTGYATDANIDVTRDLYSGPLQHTFRGHMRLDYEQVDTLESFYNANRSGFFVVRPDTDQLCVARWLKDGQPKPTSSMGVWTIYEVGLRLAVA